MVQCSAEDCGHKALSVNPYCAGCHAVGACIFKNELVPFSVSNGKMHELVLEMKAPSYTLQVSIAPEDF